MHKTLTSLVSLAIVAFLSACGGSNGNESSGDGTHTHPDGTVHADGDAHVGGDAPAGGDAPVGEGGHAHDELSIGIADIAGMRVELAQGHGNLAAGEESHLVVKLSYTDSGATIVRAWIGTEDRTLSYVGKGDYAASHDDYDIHAMAPDPLPANVMWWIEIEKPDGTKVTGSAKPLLD